MMPLAELIGSSPGMRAVRDNVERLLHQLGEGRRQPPVLIQGDTGTGKTALARMMHRACARRDGPFVSVNCGAIPQSLLESQLFGHERGAFTGAQQARAGYFQQAHRGTLFLDEVALMSEELQGTLLTAIEEKSVRRLSSARAESVDVWVIGASNADLATLVRERRFREDLYHRLAVVTFWLPPLRDRGEDIVLLAEHFLFRACREYDLPQRTLGADAKAALLAHQWPGNIRELANVTERAVLFADDPVISARSLGLTAVRPETRPVDHTPLRDELGSVERELLQDALRKTDGNLSRASKLLRLPRNTLRHRLKRAGLLSEPRPFQGHPPADLAASGGAAAAVSTVGTRWEARRLALLRVELVPTSPDGPLPAGGPIDIAVDKVQAFGGRVEERSPTGLLASFGVDAIEDAPARAAQTAVALDKAAERVRSDGEAVAIGAAIHVGRFQVDAGPVPGAIDPDSQRRARSLLDALLAAGGDAIVVSEAASAFLERHFELLPLPGSSDPASRAFRLVGRAPSGHRQGRATTTFVGRHDSLDLLERRAIAAMSGHGQVIGIVGDAGIGKSRLVAEFRERLAHREITYLEGACFSYTSSVPFLPVLAIVRQSCGIGESDSTEKTAESIRGRLGALGINVEESAPYLFHLFGLPEGQTLLATLTPEAIRARTIETLHRMILAASRQQPVVILIEDLHWTDKGSEDALASLVADVPGASIMFLSTYRPGYRPPWIEKSFATQIALSPLSPDESRTIVRGLLPSDAPESTVGAILDKAEGNPFFLEEICRAVAHDGLSEGMPAVPDTIEEILVGRIQRLPDDTRSVIEVAAVLGREFPPALLESVWRGPGALEAHIQKLADLEFVHRRATGREAAYAFKHALTQQVAYDTLAPARRRELHGAAGQALEAAYADRLDEAIDRLAYHYSKTEEAPKAVEYLGRFAEKVARSYAHGAAVQACNEALQHVERLPADGRDRRRVQLILRLADSLLPLGRIGESIGVLLGDHDRLERLRDPALAARYYFDLARAYMLGNHALVADNARRAIAEAERCGDTATMGGAFGVLTVACALSGQAPRGIECGQRAIALLEASAEQWHLSYACWALGLCFTQTGAFAEASGARAPGPGHRPDDR